MADDRRFRVIESTSGAMLEAALNTLGPGWAVQSFRIEEVANGRRWIVIVAKT